MPPIAEAFVNVRARNMALRTDLKRSVAMTRTAASAMRTALSTIGVTLGVAGIIQGMRSVIRAAAVQEDAIVRLRSALAANNMEVEQNTKNLLFQAAAIQKATVFSDEFITKLQAQAIGLGATAEGATDSVKGAIGLATALGTQLNPAMLRYVVLAQQGEFEMLRRYIPALRKTKDESEQLAIVQEFVAKGFAQAQGNAQSSIGSLKSIGNELGDISEQVGGLVVNSGVTVALNIWLKSLKAMNMAIVAFKSNFDGLVSTATDLATKVNFIVINILSGVAALTGTNFQDMLRELKAAVIAFDVGLGISTGRNLSDFQRRLKAFRSASDIFFNGILGGPNLGSVGGGGGDDGFSTRQINRMPRVNINAFGGSQTSGITGTAPSRRTPARKIVKLLEKIDKTLTSDTIKAEVVLG